jgi:dUTP pyrophosphatase
MVTAGAGSVNPSVTINIVRLAHGKAYPLPEYKTDGASGMDLVAAIDAPLSVLSGETIRVPTGIAVAIPVGYEGQVRPRSGVACRLPLIIPNAPGTIDSDYRGEIQVLITNIGQQPVAIEKGMRIAQLVIAPVARAEWAEAESLPPSQRGAGGFGHTGT